jgi:N4-gp56 family major capsid protein
MNPTDYTNTTAIQNDLQTYFAKKLLKQAKYKVVLNQFGHIEVLPSNSSKTIQFVQYADLNIVTDPLTEGVAPAGKKLSNTPITATIDQLGDYITLTDLAGLTPKHNTVQKALELLGTQASRSYDRAINDVVSAGSAVRYAGGKASRALLDTGDKLTWSDVRKEVTRLRNSGAEEFEDKNFVLVVDPSTEQDLMDDATFEKAAIAYANKAGHKSELFTGTIAVFAGVTVVRSNNLKTVTGGVGSNKTIRISLLFGTDAYAVTDLQKLETYKEGPGGISDPLRQKMTIGWKLGAKSCILNNNFMGRLESVSAY